MKSLFIGFSLRSSVPLASTRMKSPNGSKTVAGFRIEKREDSMILAERRRRIAWWQTHPSTP
jgi:hypothetical protein